MLFGLTPILLPSGVFWPDLGATAPSANYCRRFQGLLGVVEKTALVAGSKTLLERLE
jgi:hypothetical protein